jgi:hypothetical protein
MMFHDPPATAAWRHRGARSGFEVVYFDAGDNGVNVVGSTTAVEDNDTWIVTYEIELDPTWTTRHARVVGRSASGRRTTLIEADGAGHWRVDGRAARHLDGCLDVDLESSAMTNALPVHRLGLAVGDHVAAPAAYVRALDLSVERLEQRYARAPDEDGRQRYDYHAPAFDFTAVLVYDASCLVVDYPGIAVRAH